MGTIVFVCTGNTCRSPMAEAIAQHWIDGGLLGRERRYLAASAGVAATGDSPPTPETVLALAHLELPCDGRSKQLSADMIRRADIVFCMTEGHRTAAAALVAGEPEQEAKILLLDPDGVVEDPIGRGQPVYDALARRFMELIPRRLQEVFAHENRTGVGSSRD